jgi:hypothetical protein
VRFLRHLAAACLVVAVVVVLGLAWNHFAASSLAGTLPGPRHPVTPPHGIRPGRKVVNLGTFDLGLNSMLQPVNWPYLRHTVVIEAVVMAAVVIFDVSRRRARRADRAAQPAGPPSGDGEDDGPDPYRP